MGGQKHTQAREPHACYVLTRLRSPFDGPKRSLLAAHRVRPSQAPENILISQEPQADVERGRRAALAQPAPRQEQTGTKVRVWKAASPGRPACLPACLPGEMPQVVPVLLHDAGICHLRAGWVTHYPTSKSRAEKVRTPGQKHRLWRSKALKQKSRRVFTCPRGSQTRLLPGAMMLSRKYV